MPLTVAAFIVSVIVIQSQTEPTTPASMTPTLSPQHRLLSDLYERLSNLGPEASRKDRKKIRELRNDIAEQLDHIKNQPSDKRARKMQLVTDAMQISRKYSANGTSTVFPVAKDDSLNKTGQKKKRENAPSMSWNYEDVGISLTGVEDELKSEMINSLSLNERAKSRALRCGILPAWAMSKNDIKRCSEYTKMIKKMNRIVKESKKDG